MAVGSLLDPIREFQSNHAGFLKRTWQCVEGVVRFGKKSVRGSLVALAGAVGGVAGAIVSSGGAVTPLGGGAARAAVVVSVGMGAGATAGVFACMHVAAGRAGMIQTSRVVYGIGNASLGIASAWLGVETVEGLTAAKVLIAASALLALLGAIEVWVSARGAVGEVRLAINRLGDRAKKAFIQAVLHNDIDCRPMNKAKKKELREEYQASMPEAMERFSREMIQDMVRSSIPPNSSNTPYFLHLFLEEIHTLRKLYQQIQDKNRISFHDDPSSFSDREVSRLITKGRNLAGRLSIAPGVDWQMVSECAQNMANELPGNR